MGPTVLRQASSAAAFALLACSAAHAGSAGPAVIDDAQLARQVATARARFLAQQPFDRFDVAVLVRDGARWRRGSFGGERLAYPASCVKLGYLVGAVHWCAAQGLQPDCLDASVRPMIVDSDNVATGVVVDQLSGVVNVADANAAGFEAWLSARRYTERVLESYGLLGAQRLLTKTYPTNSSADPQGFEARALKDAGRNAMSPDLAAQLMLGIVSGRVEPQATRYMRGLLTRDRFSGHSGFGAGLPPGSSYQNKVGTAFDTLQDIAWARLPNGRELIIAGFSNGWDQNEPEPRDVLRLGGFTELLLAELGLDRSLPFHRTVNARLRAGELSWSLPVPRSGLYELVLWYDADPANTSSAQYRVPAANGRQLISYDQRTWGRRWLPLGQYEFARGSAIVRAESTSSGKLAGGRIRISRVPAIDARGE